MKTGLQNNVNFAKNMQKIQRKINIKEIFREQVTTDIKNNMKLYSNSGISEQNIHLIFTNLPHIKSAFMNNVPCNMSEEKFWKDLCQSPESFKKNYCSTKKENVSQFFKIKQTHHFYTFCKLSF